MQVTLQVARWEFNRFFKPKEHLIGLGIMFALMAGGAWVGAKQSASKPADVKVAVVGNEKPLQPFVKDSGIELQNAKGRAVDQLRKEVSEKKLDGALLLQSPDKMELIVRREPSWTSRLSIALNAMRQQQRLNDLQIQPEKLQAIFAPVEMKISQPNVAGTDKARSAKVIALFALIAMLIAVFTGSAYLFQSIPGEKQQRVTETVLSMISPQTWIDGKIIAFAALSLLILFEYGLGFGLVSVLLNQSFGVSIQWSSIDPLDFGLLILISLLGFLFWLTFVAAFVATIDDPQSSSRNLVIFLPMLPLSFAFGVMGNPDSPVSRILSLVPLTSPTVMPVRLVTGDVAIWELAACLALLAGSIALLRRAAGKIFGAGILITGKEPNLREIWRWAREA